MTMTKNIKKQILIVEDDKDTRFLLKKRLRAHGFTCGTASSVEEAIEILSKFKPDLILLDLMFHGPDGTAFLQYAKGRFGSKAKTPPVIVISGCHEKEIVDYLLDLGASGYIRKPINAETLLSMIQEYLPAA